MGARALTLALAVGLLSASPVRADLNCGAQVDRQRVGVGGRVVLTLHAEAQSQDQIRHDPPRLENVEVISGGTSQSFSFDSTGARAAVTVTYYLRPQRAGDFRIPPVVFRAGGQRCATEALAFTVDPAAPGQPPSTAPPATPPAGAQAGQRGDAAFITLEVDRDTVWLGQQIVMTFRYHRLRHGMQPSYTPPRTEGFWRLDLPPERSYRQTIDGQVYDVTEIRYALFPTRTGTLTIEPARLEFTTDPFDRLFGRRGRGPRLLVTDPLTVTVRELPSPPPSDFSGIVAGKLDFNASLSRESVPRGEPLTLALEVSADAFLKTFDGVVVPEPAGLRLHPATEELREDTGGPRYRAVLRQEKAVVPLQEGVVEVADLGLTYFDTGTGAYRTVAVEPLSLVVLPSDLPTIGDDPSGFRRTAIARLGRDLAFVHGADGRLRRAGPLLAHRPLWWLGLLAPWGLLALYRWRLQRQAADRDDPLGRRRRLAWPRARKQLRRLARGRGDAGELARVIQTYVGDRSGRPGAGLTAADIRAWCAQLGLAEIGARLGVILAECDRARFGGADGLDAASWAREVSSLLERLQRADRPGKRDVAPRLLVLALPLFVCAVDVAGAKAASASSAAEDPRQLLAEGNQAYTAGDLRTAGERYRQALALGYDAPELHFNLGNVHARQGELGRAVASYLRAQRLSPRDPDVRANLAWVRSLTQDLELGGGGLPPLIAQLDALAHLLSLDEWALLLLFFSWLTALAVAWTWRRGWLSPAWRRSRLLLGSLTTIVLIVTVTRWYAEVGRDVAVIVAEQVAVRSGPAETFPEVFRVHDGLTLEVRGERDSWARIGLGGDWVGWIPLATLERVRPADGAQGPGR